MISEEELNQWEQLISMTSPGPWEHEVDDIPPEPDITSGNGGVVAFVQVHGNVRTVLSTGQEFSHSDARFIAESRSAMPRLIEEVRRLQKVNKE